MTSPENFDDERFEELLETYGAQLEQWPAALRSAAQAWVVRSPRAQQAWGAAARLDELLGAAPDVEPSPALMARIAAIPITHPGGQRESWWPFRSLWPPLAAWAAAAALGVVVGSLEIPLEGGLDDAAQMSAEAEEVEASGADEQLEDWNDLSALAFGSALVPEDE